MNLASGRYSRVDLRLVLIPALVLGRIGTHDLHATILDLLGMDHQKLTCRFASRDFRLSDIAGDLVKEIIV